MSRYQRVEPHWPHGAIAQMVILSPSETGTGSPGMGMHKVPIARAIKTEDGWMLAAVYPERVIRFVEVDDEGVGSDCEPWSDELEEKFGHLRPDRGAVALDHAEPEDTSGEVIEVDFDEAAPGRIAVSIVAADSWGESYKDAKGRVPQTLDDAVEAVIKGSQREANRNGHLS